MRTNQAATCVEQVRDGHEQIQQATSALRTWWRDCRTATTPPFEELSQRILNLRDMLRSHFHDEESADHTFGMDDLPRPANNRAILLADLDQLIARLRVCHPGTDCWADAELAIDRFLGKLEDHERAELETLPDLAVEQRLPLHG